MKQFLAAVLVAVLVLPSVSQAAWTRFEDSYVFGDFVYNESTDEWVHDDGTYYESSAELFDCYGFYYDSWRDVWYNEDGYIDEDMCVRDHSDGGYFYCDSCEIFMYDAQSDNLEYHYDECDYIEEIGGYEEHGDPEDYVYYDNEDDESYADGSIDRYDSSPTTEPQDTSEVDDSPVKKCLGIIVGLVAIAFCLIPVIVWVILFVSSVISGFRSRKK